ncbi:hypothetical protein [Parapedobacter deserti]|uniref:hypothetical protein n=1 Tax=Parapedobacter deserti TaxID=1912957 RepID=UPI00366F28CC
MKRTITFACIVFVLSTGCGKDDNAPMQINYRVVKKWEHYSREAPEPYGLTEYTYDALGSDMPPAFSRKRYEPSIIMQTGRWRRLRQMNTMGIM